MVEHEAKRKKMFDEYNHQITHRADPLPIIKIRYIVNSSKEASMSITRANDPLNITVHDMFKLKSLGFKIRLSLEEHLSGGLRGNKAQARCKASVSWEEPLSDGLRGNEVQDECQALAGSERTL
ncbi:hypothetical protein Tco_1290539 [Tanacetum coccineum]